MSDYLYIPINSQNFNNIFSTEGVSPPSQYYIRNFGIRRFIGVKKNLPDACTILYDFPPLFKLEDEDSDATVFFIRILSEHLNSIELTEVVEKNSKKIYSTVNTIYLNLCKPSFIFQDNYDIKRIVNRSLSSLEAKTVKKYSDKFLTLEETNLTLEMFEVEIPCQVEDSQVLKQITFDEYFDKYKGFLYSYCVGKITSDSPAYRHFKFKLQGLLDKWGLIKNSLSHKSSAVSVKLLQADISDFLHHLDEITTLYRNIHSKEQEDVLALKMLTPILGPSEAEEFLKNIQKIPRLLETLKEMINSNSNILSKQIANIQGLLESYIYHSKEKQSKNTTSLKDNIDSQFKGIIRSILNTVEDSRTSNDNLKTFPNLKDFVLTKEGIQLPKEKEQDTDDDLIFGVILNGIFNYRRSKPGEFLLNDKLELLKLIGQKVSDVLGKNSEARKYLLELYNLLSKGNQTEFPLSKFNSLANFSSFLFRPTSIEQLIEFIDRKDIGDRYMAYSYWGTFNGFISHSRTFTKPILENEQTENAYNIDEHLKSVFRSGLVQEMSDKYQPIRKSQSNPLEAIEENEQTIQYVTFIRSWLEETVIKIKFGSESEPVYDLKDLQNNFVKAFTTPKRKGFTQELAKRLFKSINFELAFK